MKIKTGRCCGLSKDEWVSRIVMQERWKMLGTFAALCLHGSREKANGKVDGENCEWMA